MCISLYLYAFMHVYLCILYVHTCMCAHAYIYLSVCLCLLLACMHMDLYICVCVLGEEDKQRAPPCWFPCLHSGYYKAVKGQMLLWTGETSASQSAVTHWLHQLSIAYLPWDAKPLVCFLMGQCTSSFSGLHHHHVRSYVLTRAIAVPLLCVKLFSNWF